MPRPIRRPLIATLAASAALATLAIPAASPAAAQALEYRGGGFITNFQNCPPWAPVEQILLRLRPAAPPPSDPEQSRLSIFFGLYAYHLRLPPDLPFGQWVDALAVANVSGSGGYQTNPDVRPQVRRLEPPAGTAVAPNEVHLVFDIRNFDYTQDCTVRVNVLTHIR